MARDMKPHELASPVDLPGEPIAEARPLAYATVAIAVATLVLLCTNAGALAGWVDAMPPSALQQRASLAANGWSAAMDAVGLGRPRAALHAGWKRAQAARFGNEAADSVAE